MPKNKILLIEPKIVSSISIILGILYFLGLLLVTVYGYGGAQPAVYSKIFTCLFLPYFVLLSITCIFFREKEISSDYLSVPRILVEIFCIFGLIALIFGIITLDVVLLLSPEAYRYQDEGKIQFTQIALSISVVYILIFIFNFVIARRIIKKYQSKKQVGKDTLLQKIPWSVVGGEK